ncbi:MAG TPA: dihydroxyacetone kinase subunit DhaK [Spirochaetia bacterium]|nr:dihydroxyacetone kinase subunit DhaK [Spirochaetia bacterium]
MKKCMNNADDFVDESLKGICAAYPGFYAAGNNDTRAIIHPVRKDRVRIVTGGGYGHLPVFLGYVGDGLADGVAVGSTFTSPSSESILNATRPLSPRKGVLYLFGNYFGDTMNFEMSMEVMESEGVPVIIRKVSDDIASAPRERYAERRGIAGIMYAYKIAGAMADSGASLEQVAAVCDKVNASTATFGVAFSSCTLPGLDTPVFELPEEEMEIGMGIHGEPGVRRGKMLPAKALAEELGKALVDDLGIRHGDKVSVLVNGLGATSREELFVLFGELNPILQNLGVKNVKTFVGEYACSLEMAGLSITILKLDDELERLLLAPAYSPLVNF